MNGSEWKWNGKWKWDERGDSLCCEVECSSVEWMCCYAMMFSMVLYRSASDSVFASLPSQSCVLVIHHEWWWWCEVMVLCCVFSHCMMIIVSFVVLWCCGVMKWCDVLWCVVVCYYVLRVVMWCCVVLYEVLMVLLAHSTWLSIRDPVGSTVPGKNHHITTQYHTTSPSYNITQHHTTSHNITQHHTTSHNITISYNITLPYNTIS